ncbi:MAG: hypothetical protein DMF80_11085, partial [Acidobacteria bacterium]
MLSRRSSSMSGTRAAEMSFPFTAKRYAHRRISSSRLIVASARPVSLRSLMYCSMSPVETSTARVNAKVLRTAFAWLRVFRSDRSFFHSALCSTASRISPTVIRSSCAQEAAAKDCLDPGPEEPLGLAFVL